MLWRASILLFDFEADIQGGLWPMLAFMAVVSAVALRRYRQTLD